MSICEDRTPDSYLGGKSTWSLIVPAPAWTETNVKRPVAIVVGGVKMEQTLEG